MKNTILKTTLGTTILIMSANCSNNNRDLGLGDDNIFSAPPMYIKKIVHKVYDNYAPGGPTGCDYTFNYNDSKKLLNIVDATSNKRLDFTYDGNKIITAKWSNISDNTLVNTIQFTYNGDIISSITSDYGSSGYKFNYEYSNNQISKTNLQSLYAGTWSDPSTMETFQWNTSGDVSQYVYSFNSFNYNNYKLTYEYDNKRNPFLYMNTAVKYLNTAVSITVVNPFCKHNIAKSVYYSPSGSTTSSKTITYKIEYNSKNFPTSIYGYTKLGTIDNIVSSTTFEYIE